MAGSIYVKTLSISYSSISTFDDELQSSKHASPNQHPYPYQNDNVNALLNALRTTIKCVERIEVSTKHGYSTHYEIMIMEHVHSSSNNDNNNKCVAVAAIPNDTATSRMTRLLANEWLLADSPAS